jgi:hypothetical protein
LLKKPAFWLVFFRPLQVDQGIDWEVFDREFGKTLRGQSGHASHENTVDCWFDVFAVHV